MKNISDTFKEKQEEKVLIGAIQAYYKSIGISTVYDTVLVHGWQNRPKEESGVQTHIYSREFNT